MSILKKFFGGQSTNVGIGQGVSGTLPVGKANSVVLTGSYSGFSGSYYPSAKTKNYILTSNKMMFDTHIALGKSNEDKAKNEYVFVEKPDDITENGQLEILEDFCLNPKITEILTKINTSTYFYK